jgi:hypothetical protein
MVERSNALFCLPRQNSRRPGPGFRLTGILLFDETDAPFEKRGEVRDGHDRQANLKVNYFLKPGGGLPVTEWPVTRRRARTAGIQSARWSVERTEGEFNCVVERKPLWLATGEIVSVLFEATNERLGVWVCR